MKTLGNLILVAAICVAIFIVFMALQPANAQEWSKEELKEGTKVHEFTRFTAPGKRLALESVAYMGLDCVIGESDETITKEPDHGTVAIEIIERNTFYSKDSTYYKCNDKKHRIPTIIYRAAIGYTGTDTFEVTSISPAGYANVYRYTIKVIDRSKKQGRAELDIQPWKKTQ
jgi:hypothetical protein